MGKKDRKSAIPFCAKSFCFQLELTVATLHSKKASLKEIVEAIREELKKDVGEEKWKELYQKLVEAFKVDAEKPNGFFRRFSDFITRIFRF